VLFFPSVKAVSCSVTLTKTCKGLCTQPNMLKSKQTKKCLIDIHVKTKNWNYTCSEVLTESSAAFIPSIQLTLHSFTSMSSLYFEARIALSIFHFSSWQSLSICAMKENVRRGAHGLTGLVFVALVIGLHMGAILL